MDTQEAAVLYKAENPITSLPELLEQFAQKIANLESRVADLEKGQNHGQ